MMKSFPKNLDTNCTNSTNFLCKFVSKALARFDFKKGVERRQGFLKVMGLMPFSKDGTRIAPWPAASLSCLRQPVLDDGQSRVQAKNS